MSFKDKPDPVPATAPAATPAVIVEGNDPSSSPSSSSSPSEPSPAPAPTESSWSFNSWKSMIPGYNTSTTPKKQEASSTALDARPNAERNTDQSRDQVTDYEEGERRDVEGNVIQFGKQGPQQQNYHQEEEDQDSRPDSPEGHSKASVVIIQEEGRRGGSTHGDQGNNNNKYNKNANSVVKEAGNAVTSLSKAVLKRKNVVLPSYYDQFPDAAPSLITLPVGQIELSMQGSAPLVQAPSFLQSAYRTLTSWFFPRPTNTPSLPTSDKNTQRGSQGIRKVVIFGIHGWFPTKLVRTVIGEPTGTSKKFCEEMDLALKDYLRMHHVELDPEDVTLIPLEGEGKVLDRVDILYQYLVKNPTWRRALQEADLVLVATHSQGTPTSILLVARLIREGLLRVEENDPRMQRIGILTMAGISHGPFPFLKGNLIVRWFEAEAAGELFEFMDSETMIAKKYREGLKTVLSSGVRLTCVASLEDQVVPLYSAVMTSIHHPSIVRAVYIDGTSFQDDFLTNLISFSLRLRNAGVDDHGILVHLSEVIAGSLYGEGHSTIYDEREVYLLSIRSLLEPPTSLTPERARSDPILNPFRAKQRLNPFYLPWGMRGVAEEVKARGDDVLLEEFKRLQRLYTEWNPVAKGMKEIKFRLEPVRSKL